MQVLAGEAHRTELLDEVADVLARVLRKVRPEAITVRHAGDLCDRAIVIEKAAASLKLLVAGRAAEGQGDKTAAADLARKAGTSLTKARSTLDSSKHLADQPAVEDALRQGRLSEDQTTAITDAVDKNPAAAPKLLDEARLGSMRGLRDACGKAKADADADEEATHLRNHARRSLRTTTDTDASFLGFLRSTTAEGARFMACLAPFRERIFTHNHKHGIRDSFEAVEHDALMAMAQAAHAKVTGCAWPGDPSSPAGTAGSGADRSAAHAEESGFAWPGEASTPAGTAGSGADSSPGDGPDAVGGGVSAGGSTVAAVKPPATVYVVADFDRLVGRHPGDGESAYIAGFGNVPTSVVREILDDAFLVGVVMKGTEVATIRRFGRHIPAEIRDALMIEHRFRCSTPGCDNWARLEIDHKHPRGKGGETTKANLDPLCTPCHREKSEQDRLIWDDIPYRDSG
jgi:hypothetical protein